MKMRFAALTLSIMAASYVALGLFSFPLSFIAAIIPQQLLGAAGVETQLVFAGGSHHLAAAEWDAEINEACWGRLELAVLFAVILASENRALKKRLGGVALGSALALLAFNPLRITISLLTLNELLHDVLFRASLLLAIVGYYAWWYKNSGGVNKT